ncbi:MAG: PASTA domain-containing protein [Candidatus Delongbacteria bacterium]|nr:PASTA domain-containing protein [Candidatus Delongbacteria bacterium]
MKIFTISVITSAAASFIVCLLIFSGVINLKKIFPEDFFPSEEKVTEIVTPNLVNLKIADAENAARSLGIGVVREDVFVENTQPDLVVEQFPLPGYRTSKGDAVKLKVSKAVEIQMEMMSEEDMMAEFDDIELSAKIMMPDITGLNSVTAIDILKRSGLENISQTEAEDDFIDKGKIINFNPPAGSEIEEDTPVDIVISKGPSIKMVIVPNLYNKSLQNAKNEIEKNGLKLGKVNKVTDVNKGFDRIIGQSVKWGDKVKEGTVIDIDLNAEAEEKLGW